ncbi:MAG: hypothetical protein ABI758_06970 [Candidatus Woesebacteria bacterium]
MVMINSGEQLEVKGKAALAQIAEEARALERKLGPNDLHVMRQKNPLHYLTAMTAIENVLRKFDDLPDQRKEGHRQDFVGLRLLYYSMKEKEQSENRAKERIFVPKRLRTEDEVNIAYVVSQFKKIVEKYTDVNTGNIRSIPWSEFEKMSAEEQKEIQADAQKAKALESKMQLIRDPLWIDYPEMKIKIEKVLGVLKPLD